MREQGGWVSSMGKGEVSSVLIFWRAMFIFRAIFIDLHSVNSDLKLSRIYKTTFMIQIIKHYLLPSLFMRFFLPCGNWAFDQSHEERI
jgi:hypothetical protein